MRLGTSGRTWAAVCLICLLGAAATGCTSSVAGSTVTVWTRVWSVGFTGPEGSGVDTRLWKYDTGTGVFGNGEIETMTDSPDNVHLDGRGDLDIRAIYQQNHWTSGRIQTTGNFGAPAGGQMKVSAVIEQPDPADSLGYWPAFWMLGPGSWPRDGEIDVLEDVNGLSDYSGALHCGNLIQVNPDGTLGPCHEYTGLSSGLRACGGCQTGYHVYSVTVDRRNAADEQIRWYVDGRQYFSVNESQMGAQTWNAAVNHGFSIILDLAIGGQYPNERCGCVTPTSQTSSGGTLQVRSVSVYES